MGQLRCHRTSLVSNLRRAIHSPTSQTTYMFLLDFDHVKKGEDPALRQNLNNQNIGNVMKRLGFKKIHKKNGNGWAVIEKEGSEINNDAFVDPNDTVED